MSKPLLQLIGISYSYPGMKEPLFDRITFSMHTGERIGLLGFNGSGKTTLFDIIADLRSPDHGDIRRYYDRIYYMQQEDYASGDITVFEYILKSKPDLYNLYTRIQKMERKGITQPIQYSEMIHEFNAKDGYGYLQQVEKTMSLLGFQEHTKTRYVNTLSGGERRLLKLASGFIHVQDLYLLDEPTNYFDDRGIQYLIKGIRAAPAAFLIISHDRWFLDQTVDKILEIEQKTIREYSGGYSIFNQTKQTELKTKIRKRDRIETQIDKLRETERKYKTWGSRKEKEKGVRFKRDGDKKSVDKGNIGHKAAKLMKKSIQAKERVLKKINELEQSKPYIERWYDFNFKKVCIHSGSCLSANNVTKSFKDTVLFKHLSFTVGWGEKVAISGPNGSGKTTLLRIIIGLTVPTGGEVIFSKEQKRLDFDSYRPSLSLVGPYLSLYGSLTARENLKFISKVNGTLSSDMNIDKLLDKVGLDGRGDDYVSEFSSGMQQRLKYAAALIKNPSILILDEPTSNLDDEGKKRVFNIINQYRPDSIIIIATNEKEE
ncbi:ABC-F family ATP-binding cassette domain-containing protein, partial [Candidatus Pacearchaeota archaeon]|nr:ABC-F family ATP-binding cassette domain-containing protein [Candidatus Pacearchaeota archaeon]